ncbi:hypothetical protein Rsub_01605 [Raphidocelis subcapitata]|uniref:HTH myb-type domain-containing protein n=1 Tax=Raphidocelis subcapitata TaxID=307507 RepID=A0A2V0NMH9_9CHLO|nr:hypothetical protein Rsub_01605 [Raphidocelis subcapitata]|eukprot:GBF88706.1 hypothetical protein Rsub_01605 [Raphidocelis subcapitata]
MKRSWDPSCPAEPEEDATGPSADWERHSDGSLEQLNGRPRIRWTATLHDRFVAAVEHLGGEELATPKGILEVMGAGGLTIAQVKSHLQRWRRVKRAGGETINLASCNEGGGDAQRPHNCAAAAAAMAPPPPLPCGAALPRANSGASSGSGAALSGPGARRALAGPAVDGSGALMHGSDGGSSDTCAWPQAAVAAALDAPGAGSALLAAVPTAAWEQMVAAAAAAGSGGPARAEAGPLLGSLSCLAEAAAQQPSRQAEPRSSGTGAAAGALPAAARLAPLLQLAPPPLRRELESVRQSMLQGRLAANGRYIAELGSAISCAALSLGAGWPPPLPPPPPLLLGPPSLPSLPPPAVLPLELRPAPPPPAAAAPHAMPEGS